jgi:hypothetical protein
MWGSWLGLIPPEATLEMWSPFDKLRTALSPDAGVRIEARDRKGPESQGQGVALSGALRVQRLAWASKGERVVYSLPKPGAPRANGALPCTHEGVRGEHAVIPGQARGSTSG